jgi:hypothetical protein
MFESLLITLYYTALLRGHPALCLDQKIDHRIAVLNVHVLALSNDWNTPKTDRILLKRIKSDIKWLKKHDRINDNLPKIEELYVEPTGSGM